MLSTCSRTRANFSGSSGAIPPGSKAKRILVCRILCLVAHVKKTFMPRFEQTPNFPHPEGFSSAFAVGVGLSKSQSRVLTLPLLGSSQTARSNSTRHTCTLWSLGVTEPVTGFSVSFLPAEKGIAHHCTLCEISAQPEQCGGPTRKHSNVCYDPINDDRPCHAECFRDNPLHALALHSRELRVRARSDGTRPVFRERTATTRSRRRILLNGPQSACAVGIEQTADGP